LVRADGAGCIKAWLAHLRSLRDECGLDVSFSVGFTMTEQVQQAILALPEAAWTPAVDTDGDLRAGAEVAELTGMLPDPTAAGWPDRMRVIVRRERPHPGGQLTFTDIDGWRFQAFATDTEVGQLAALEARHRGHTTVENASAGKHTGLGRFPSRHFAISAVWLELALTACGLIVWTQTTLLDGELAKAEPKTLRYRRLRVAARIIRNQRRLFVRMAEHWHWRHQLAAAFACLAALPQPLRIGPAAIADRPPPRTSEQPAPSTPATNTRPR
jgi:Transposase DDE domain group 1